MASSSRKKTGDQGEKKLYGAAKAAHEGVLYGAAKKSAEQKAARLKSERKEASGSKSKSAGKTQKAVKEEPAKKKAEPAGKAAAAKTTASAKKAEPAGRTTATAKKAESAVKASAAKKQENAKKAEPEKKLYGAAKAAHEGVLFGAAKKSAEERAARLAAEKKSGKASKSADGKAAPEKKTGSRKAEASSGEKKTAQPEKKLYGAAKAAHEGVLFGAAKKSAEERAARLAAEQKSGKTSKSSSVKNKAEKKEQSSAGAGTEKKEKAGKQEKKLYGAAKAAHEGILYGAAKKSAEERAKRLQEGTEAESRQPAAKDKKKKKSEKAAQAEIASSIEEIDAKDAKNKRALTWEEEELLLAGDSEDPTAGHEIDEVLHQRFRKKISDLLVLAKKKKNVLEFNDIKDYMADMGLDDEHLERVLEILESEGIDVLKTDEDIDELPADDEILNEEEDDVENLDLTVPDSVAIEDPVRMYLKEIGKVPLLTAEEEIVLAKRMEKGLEAEKKLRDDRTKMTPDGRKNVMDRIKAYEKELKELKGDDEETELERVRKQELIDNAKKMLEQDKLKKKLSPAEKAKLKDPIADGEEAKNKLAEANLRLVVSIAKRYVGRGMLFLDLIQEGNLGLIKAVEKFDFRKGFKFSTYATWWIRQAITRAIADQARTIRIPVHMVETINKLIRVSRQLLQELGREPVPEEIAEKMNMPVDRVREILKISQEPVSLETPIGEEEDSHLGDFIQDDHVPVPADAAAFTLLKEQLIEVLGTLTDREQKVLRLRFGLDDGRARTLEEVGKEFNVTRERIRQIEAKALRKLRHPSRSKKLKDYLD